MDMWDPHPVPDQNLPALPSSQGSLLVHVWLTVERRHEVTTLMSWVFHTFPIPPFFSLAIKD